MKIKKQAQPKKEDAFGESPSQDYTDRFPVDVLLREQGFRIWKRCKKQEPVWWRDGMYFHQHEALLRINKREVSRALQAAV